MTQALRSPSTAPAQQRTLFRSIAAHIIDEIAPPSKPEDIDMAGCSARLFDSDDAAFAELETAVTVGPR